MNGVDSFIFSCVLKPVEIERYFKTEKLNFNDNRNIKQKVIKQKLRTEYN